MDAIPDSSAVVLLTAEQAAEAFGVSAGGSCTTCSSRVGFPLSTLTLGRADAIKA